MSKLEIRQYRISQSTTISPSHLQYASKFYAQKRRRKHPYCCINNNMVSHIFSNMFSNIFSILKSLGIISLTKSFNTINHFFLLNVCNSYIQQPFDELLPCDLKIVEIAKFIKPLVVWLGRFYFPCMLYLSMLVSVPELLRNSSSQRETVYRH